MAKLTPDGEQIVAGLAEQYKIGADAVKAMLDAVAKGGGATAQFNVPEFGGAGQWMRGGQATVGDMVSASMKATAENLCNELSNLMAAQASLFVPASQPPSYGESASGGGKEGASASPRPSPYGWWPAELGEPSMAGSRNSWRYAYFAAIRRLAVDARGRVEVYDTTGFNIEGIAPRQGSEAASPVFASNRGPVRLDSLPREYGMAAEAKPAPEPTEAAAKSAAAPADAQAQQPAAADAVSILALIEQLGALKEKGILTEEEFAAKKAELLKRL
jgi:Short C-terminal domain